MKQLVLINQITKGMGTVVLFIIQKLEESTFSPQEREDGKVVEEGFNRE